MVNESATRSAGPEHQGTQTIGGLYRVGKLLYQSGTGAVHETEFGDAALPAVIRIRRGDTPESEEVVERWRKAIELEHPNLLRVYAAGSAALFDVPVIYVVMERADESLAGVLAERPLSEKETREMLVPAIAALRHLHKNGYAHAGLKPSNILACADVLKLSSDSIKPIGDEASPVDDMWALGETIVQSLTRKRPKVVEELGPYILREASQTFTDIVRHCLDPDAYRRWNLDQVEARLAGRAAVFTPPVVKPSPTAVPPAMPPVEIKPAALSEKNPPEKASPEKKEDAPRVIVLPVRESPPQDKSKPAAREPIEERTRHTRVPVYGGDRYREKGAHRTLRWILPGLAVVVLVVAMVAYLRVKPSAPVSAATSPVPAFSEAPAPSHAAGLPALPPAEVSQPFKDATPIPAPVAPLALKAPDSGNGARRAQGWSVIVAAYNVQGPAEKRRQQMSKRWPKFNLAIQEQQAGKTVYLVVLGENLSEDQAKSLRKRAIASGLPRDTYIKRIQ